MYIDLKEKDFTKLEEPAQIIKNGGIVVFPTETVYGIGANALNAEAVKKIYEIKKRPLSKPITLLVNSIDMIERVAKGITPFEYAIIKKFFPGPLTIILQKKEKMYWLYSNYIVYYKEALRKPYSNYKVADKKNKRYWPRSEQ